MLFRSDDAIIITQGADCVVIPYEHINWLRDALDEACEQATGYSAYQYWRSKQQQESESDE